MIISASYKTDVPAFYGQWFINRLHAGYCMMLNPYNQRAIRVSLLPQDVEGIVFWTKNLTPFMKHLPAVRQASLPFVIQFGINGYPRTLERCVIDAERSIDNLRQAAEEYGPKVCVWRYDTIVFSSVTPFDFHLRNFEQLARKLGRATDEVVISFAQFYRKTLRNMKQAADQVGFTWNDPAREEKRRLASELVQIASIYGMRLSICSQRDYLVEGAHDARCIDAQRFEQITGKPVPAKLRGNRKECGCYQCRDIGQYDTCPHGCVYCYAVNDPAVARRNYQRHDPNGEFLFAPNR